MFHITTTPTEPHEYTKLNLVRGGILTAQNLKSQVWGEIPPLSSNSPLVRGGIFAFDRLARRSGADIHKGTSLLCMGYARRRRAKILAFYTLLHQKSLKFRPLRGRNLDFPLTQTSSEGQILAIPP